MDNVLLAVHLHVSEYDAGQISREIAVAAECRGERVGKEGDAGDEDNVEAIHLEGNTLQNAVGQKAAERADCNAEDKLRCEQAEYAAGIGLAGQKGEADQGQHVGHGIVTTALEFQDGSRVLF